MGCWKNAFNTFASLKDTLFSLLTARLIAVYAQQQKIEKDRQDYESVYNQISKSPDLHNLKLDLLFENFDRRLDLARIVRREL